MPASTKDRMRPRPLSSGAAASALLDWMTTTMCRMTRSDGKKWQRRDDAYDVGRVGEGPRQHQGLRRRSSEAEDSRGGGDYSEQRGLSRRG
jgi:hypothetical protein